MDMTEGLIARFRTMAIYRGSVLIGHVVGSVLQCVMSVVLVGAVAVAIGLPVHGRHRPGVVAGFGLLTLVRPGAHLDRGRDGPGQPEPEAASNMAMPLILLPLISSAFIPVDTMPGWFQPIAEYQPFTPAIETLRGLLLGTEIGNNGWIAIAWCVGLIALGYAGRRRSSTATRSSRDDRAGRLRVGEAPAPLGSVACRHPGPPSPALQLMPHTRPDRALAR